MKVFRNLRLKNLGSKKFKSYLLYALGEIILVVIGIYIAIQLNVQKQVQKNRVIEKVYLNNILSDLNEEVIDLEKIIEVRNYKSKAAQRIITYIDEVEVNDLVAFNQDQWSVFQWPVHHANDNSFKELMNSGNLFKIKDNTIRRALLDLNAQYEQLGVTRDHLRFEYHEFLYEEIVEAVDYDLMWNADKKYSLTSTDSLALKQNIKEIRGNKVLKNAYVMAKHNNAYMGQICKEALVKVKEIIKLVEDDLAKDE